jgi:hypothetical protein
MSTTTAQITARETANAARKIVKKLPIRIADSNEKSNGLYICKNSWDKVLMSYKVGSYDHIVAQRDIDLPLAIAELEANGFLVTFCDVTNTYELTR